MRYHRADYTPIYSLQCGRFRKRDQSGHKHPDRCFLECSSLEYNSATHRYECSQHLARRDRA
jgi:hypothetical protein